MAAQAPVTNEKTTAGEKAPLVAQESPRSETSDNSALLAELYPADSWVEHNGQMVYWADLPRKERSAFAWKAESADWSHMIGTTWAEFKSDPLLPVINYWRNYVMPGFGLFTEGYVLFSIGNLKTLFSAAWPQCWKTYEVCKIRSVQTTDYLQVVGIIIGQATVGYEADWIGRRWGLIQDAVIMLLGSTLITTAWGTNLQGWIAMYAVSQFIYGCGVGGEYPITATTSMERASKGRATADDRLHRGRKTVGAFLMQGWGQFVNQGLLIILLLISNSSGQGPYSVGAAQVTYRLSFVFVTICILWLLYYRIWRQKGSDSALLRAKAKSNVSGYDIQSLKLALVHFWPRIIATAGGWWANDFQFYGAKIFASTFIPIVVGGSPSTMTTWLYNLINVGVALFGYYFGFFLIDSKFYGRWTMQMVGFALTFSIFLVVTAAWDQLRVPGAPVHAFQWLYFMSSFFQQFGPNCVTFLVAAEVYPAAIRGSAHGASAAIGKVGALIPTVLYNYISDRNKFVAGTVTGFFGLLVTFFFLPDVSGLDLHEQERRWLCIREGRPQDYHGIAIHPRHLSWWERVVQKQHLNYDPVLDRKQRLAELRDIFNREQAQIATEADAKVAHGHEEDEDSELSPELHRFFMLERRSSTDTLVHHVVPQASGQIGYPRTGDALQ